MSEGESKFENARGSVAIEDDPYEFVKEVVVKRRSEDVNFLTHPFAAKEICEKSKVVNHRREVHE